VVPEQRRHGSEPFLKNDRTQKVIATVLCGLALAWSAGAQNVIAPPPPEYSGMSPALSTTGTNQPGEVPPLATTPAGTTPFELGPVQFRPHLLYRFLYGDGIPAAPGQQLKTVIQQLYPGIFMQLGNHWNLDYTPVLSFYSNNQFRDTWDNSVVLSGATATENWTLGFSQSYVSSSQPLVETGTQTDTETYYTAVNAVYRMSSAASLELGANQNFVFVGQSLPGQALSDTLTWSTLDWLNYQFSPKFGAAVGAGFGYTDFRAGSDMTFEQIQGRITWRPGAKLYVSVSGGGNSTQLLDSGGTSLVTPTYGVSAQYQIFETTTLGLGANRVTSPSLYVNQLNDTISVTGNLHQRLLKNFFLDLSGGYSKVSYLATTAGFSQSREDNYTFFNARLSTVFLKRANAAIFFQTSDNTSTGSEFALSSTQVGFELGYRY
jgi:hypothetical protein